MSGKVPLSLLLLFSNCNNSGKLMKHIATHASPPTLPQSSSVQQTLASVLLGPADAASVFLGPADAATVLLGPADAASVLLCPADAASVFLGSQQTLPQSSSVQQTRLSLQQTLATVLLGPADAATVLLGPADAASVLLGPADAASVLLGPADAASVLLGPADAASVPPRSSRRCLSPPRSSRRCLSPPRSSRRCLSPPWFSRRCLSHLLSSQNAQLPKKRTVTCSQCDLTLLAKNLRTHIRRHHTEKENTITPERHFQSQCIDEKNCIFAVEKVFLGQATPIHVIKNTWGPNYRSACELDQCILNAEFAP